MPFKFLRANFNGDPNIGLYGFATDKYCLIGTTPGNKILQKLKESLDVEIVTSTISCVELAGLFVAGNSNGILIPSIAEDSEIRGLEKCGLNVVVLDSRENALGNLILCNDSGCMISGSLRKHRGEISDALGCEVEVGKIADLDIVGACGIVNNKGCLCHREASEEEMKAIESLLKVKVDVGSVSYGSPFIKSGIIVNSKGAAFSAATTGAEVGRIEEVFG
jgi:translation initiation factor 6